MRSLSKREIYLIYTAVLLLVFYVGNIVLGIWNEGLRMRMR